MAALRALTDDGLAEAGELLARVRSGESAGIDEGFLHDATWSTPTETRLPKWRLDDFPSRWHLAVWLFRALGERGATVSPNAWSWLALHLFDVVCPVVNGTRAVREDARYLLRAGDFRKSYRHLVAGPYLLFLAHNDAPGVVRGLLATAPNAPGEVYEQLAARKFLVTSRAVVGTATRMYFDEATGRLRRGAGGSQGGSPRRFSDILQQLDRTYDLQAMEEETLVNLLPGEFGRFLT